MAVGPTVGIGVYPRLRVSTPTNGGSAAAAGFPSGAETREQLHSASGARIISTGSIAYADVLERAASAGGVRTASKRRSTSCTQPASSAGLPVRPIRNAPMALAPISYSAYSASQGEESPSLARGRRRRSWPPPLRPLRASTADSIPAVPSRCNSGLAFYSDGLQGRRNYMEDRTLIVPQLEGVEGASILGVFDGHGGAEVAELCVNLLPQILAKALGRVKDPQRALHDSFMQLDQEIRDIQSGTLTGFDKVGSTATIVLAVRRAGRLRLLCANCGDSRAVLSRGGVAVDLSDDHKPQNPSERRRIEAAGGYVVVGDTTGRVDGSLAVSRALGDFKYKARTDLPADRQKVIACPDIKEIPVGKSDEFVAVASDGVFGVFSSEELIAKLGFAKRRGTSWQEASRAVLEESVIAGDNASLCIAHFTH